MKASNKSQIQWPFTVDPDNKTGFNQHSHYMQRTIGFGDMEIIRLYFLGNSLKGDISYLISYILSFLEDPNLSQLHITEVLKSS